MIGEAAARLVKVLVPLPQRLLEVRELPIGSPRGRREPIDPGIEDSRVVHLQRPIRTEGRIDLRRRPDAAMAA